MVDDGAPRVADDPRGGGDGAQGSAGPAAHFAVHALVSKYCMAVDDGRFDDFAALFTTDARFHVMDSTHEGAAAIGAFMDAAQPPEARGRHSIGAVVLDIDPTSGTGRGWVDYVFFDAGESAVNIGRYHDEYTRGTDGRWRFAVREIVFRGSRPQLTGDWS